jgi:hypothetical protein
VRRECLDHVIVLNVSGLRTILKSYIAYYLKSRTHLSLDKDAPVSRPVVCENSAYEPTRPRDSRT